MLNNKGFDLWAENYDQSVRSIEENNDYPFAGYKEILSTIYTEIVKGNCLDILDIGFGTGHLTKKLYDHGCKIDGFDFSPNMIEQAKVKMPTANLFEWDLKRGVPPQLDTRKYDAIVSIYVLHHFTDDEKVQIICELLKYLKPKGKLFIGDIAFSTKEQWDECYQKYHASWDEDEYYFVFESFINLVRPFCEAKFLSISHCGGIIEITNKNLK